jgi:hypothetical protein
MDHKAEIIRLAEAKAEALVKRDTAALGKILHDDFQYTNSHGMTYDKESYVGLFLGSAEMTFKSQEYKDAEVSVHGVIGIFEAVVADIFTYQGKERRGRYKTIQLFLLENGQWKWLRGMTVGIE